MFFSLQDLAADNIRCEVVTGGGTGTYMFEAQSGGTAEQYVITLLLPSSKSTFSQLFREKHISEAVGIITIFHLSKLWKAKFFILCNVIFMVRLQGKIEIDHSWGVKGLIVGKKVSLVHSTSTSNMPLLLTGREGGGGGRERIQLRPWIFLYYCKTLASHPGFSLSAGHLNWTVLHLF